MTEIFSDGFESGGVGNWTANQELGGTNTVVTTAPHHGTYHLNSTVTSDADVYLYKDFTRALRQLNERAYLRVVSGFTLNGFWFYLRDVAGTQAIAYLGTSGSSRYLYMRYHDSGGAHYLTSDTVFPNDGNYHCLEIQFIPSATDASFKVFLDGSEVADLTVTGLNANFQSDRAAVGGHAPASSYTSGVLYGDCVVVADAYIGTEGAPPPEGQPYISRVQHVTGMQTFNPIHALKVKPR